VDPVGCGTAYVIDRVMKISVGTGNGTKIAAVVEACREVLGEFEVVSTRADSGVSDMPTTDDEMIAGAMNRARDARERTGADLSFGLEGGMVETLHGWFLRGWVAVYDGREYYLGCSPGILVPENIACQVTPHVELGEVMDRVAKRKGVKGAEGAYGILTRNKIDWKAAFKAAVLSALAPIYNEEMYKAVKT